MIPFCFVSCDFVHLPDVTKGILNSILNSNSNNNNSNNNNNNNSNSTSTSNSNTRRTPSRLIRGPPLPLPLPPIVGLPRVSNYERERER